MTRNPKRAVLAAILVPALLAALAAGASRLVYGRSLRASVYEAMLRRRYGHPRTPEEEIDRLEARRAAGEKPCAPPEALRFRVPIAERTLDGMQVFTLNEGADSGITVLYLHGGAYINPINAYQWRFMDRLAAEARCRVVAPAYRLAPWGDCAQAYADLSALWQALKADSPEDRILLMGDSAGGGLALGLAEALAAENAPLPEQLILFSPWVDVSMDNPDIPGYQAGDPILHLELVTLHGRYWAGDMDVHDWHASPLYGDMTGLPPVTLYCGTRELLYPDILLARDKLAEAGVSVDCRIARGMNHDYPLMPLPEAEAAVREVVARVKGE